jgi:hypothetical protein
MNSPVLECRRAPEESGHHGLPTPPSELSQFPAHAKPQCVLRVEVRQDKHAASSFFSMAIADSERFIFETAGYTKRRVAKPYREGVPTPCDPRLTTHLHRAVLPFSRSCRNPKQALDPPTSHGNSPVAARRVHVPPHTGYQSVDCDRLVQADRVAQAAHGWPQRKTRLRWRHRINMHTDQTRDL